MVMVQNVKFCAFLSHLFLNFNCGLQLLKRFPKDLASLKRAQLLSFYMGQPDPFLGLVQQVLKFLLIVMVTE